MPQKMDEVVKIKWLAALRSGMYRQGKQALKRYPDEKKCEYCCLGVLMEIQREDFEVPQETDEMPTLQFLKLVGLISDEEEKIKHYGIATDLASMNDKGDSFNEIANYINLNL